MNTFAKLSLTRLRGLLVLADDDPRWQHDPVFQAEAACRGGAAAVQLRAKHAPDRIVLGWAQAIRKITQDYDALFFVNDRFDLALLAEADGVHLGQEDFPPLRLPTTLRERLLIGRSSHTLVEAGAAAQELVDYVAFGPVFETTSKRSSAAPRGLSLLRSVVDAVAPLPVVAIGGIDVARAAAVLHTGVAAIAVLSAVAGATEPETATRALKAALTAPPASPPT